jgi:hypothetical protein
MINGNITGANFLHQNNYTIATLKYHATSSIFMDMEIQALAEIKSYFCMVVTGCRTKYKTYAQNKEYQHW